MNLTRRKRKLKQRATGCRSEVARTLTMGLATGLAAFASAHAETPVTLGSGNRHLRVEALNEGGVRLWYASSARFIRKPSLATEAAPNGRVALRRASANGGVAH